MKRAGLALIFGVALGAIGIAVFQRLQQEAKANDPEAVAEQIDQALKQLEERAEANV